MKVLFKAKVLALAALVSALGAAWSWAQDVVIEEIVVTAQKRAQAIDDVPLSIEAASEEQLKDQTIYQMKELSAVSPNLTMAASFTGYANTYSGRGIIGQTNLDPVVSFYLDDVPFAWLGAGWSPNANLADIERIEVINGPQGTLYGQGAMGGTVRVITVDPDSQEFSGMVRFAGSTTKDGDPSYGGDVVLNVPLAEDVAAARLVYSRQEQGGFIDHPNIGLLSGAPSEVKDANDAEYEDVRLKVMVTPNDNLTLKASYWRSEAESPYGDLTDYDTTDRKFSAQFLHTNVGETKTDAGSVSISYDFENFNVFNSVSLLDGYLDQFATALGILGTYELDAKTLANEFRISSTSTGPLQWMVGHYYQDSESDLLLGIILGPPVLPGPTPFGEEVTKRDSTVSAFFGEVSYDFNEQVTLLLGARFFDDERKVDNTGHTGVLSFVLPGIVPPLIDIQLEEDFDSFNPRINLSYRPNDDLMIYANVAKGFRSGTFNLGLSLTAATLAGVTADIGIIDPDKVWSYEIGAAYNSPDGKWRLRGAAFTQEWEDSQTFVTFNPALFVSTILNLADQQIDGFEYGIDFMPTNGLSISLHGVYIDTKYKNVFEAAAPFLVGIEEGGFAVGVPEKSQILASVTYETAINEALGLRFHVNHSYRSKQADATASGLNVGSVEDTNLRITLSDNAGRWDAALFVNNVLDEDENRELAFSLFASSPRPREIGLELSFQF